MHCAPEKISPDILKDFIALGNDQISWNILEYMIECKGVAAAAVRLKPIYLRSWRLQCIVHQRKYHQISCKILFYSSVHIKFKILLLMLYILSDPITDTVPPSKVSEKFYAKSEHTKLCKLHCLAPALPAVQLYSCVMCSSLCAAVQLCICASVQLCSCEAV